MHSLTVKPSRQNYLFCLFWAGVRKGLIGTNLSKWELGGAVTTYLSSTRGQKSGFRETFANSKV